ncbi:MAG TPA: SusC/RagA family TonB-linked outer membrane protein, partial [Chitinophagaceae bacterium]|nr:SusC/RagA family TonB-linked outer membrane protein [Chitinophagaceae bacterium]
DAASAGVIRSATTYPTSISDVEGYDEAGQGYFITNPVIYSRDVLNQVNGVNIFSSNYLEVALMKGLKFRQNVGINYGTTTRDQYYPRTVYEGYSVRGWGLKADNLWNSLISESILNYNTTIHDDHSIGGMVAATYERTDGQWKRAEAKTFPNDLLKNENLAAGEMIMPVINSRYQSTLISFLGRVNYAYKDKYLLNASYRRDGSSKFGRENKWAGFSSFGVAWKLSKENFMSRVRGISDLKVRFSYGQSGNQGIGSYASLSKLAVYNYVFDGALQTGLADDVFAGAANENLRWETTSAYNAGLDLALFKNRLTLSVDVYQKKTEDLLQFITTPASTGFERQLRNSGSVQNRGIEVQLGGDIVKGKNFEWSANFNIAFNRNKILSLGSDVLEQYAGNISTGDAPFIQIAGKPIGALYGYMEDGYYDNEAEVRSDPMYANQSDAIIKRMIGEVKYRNLDNDPTSISVTDRTFIGNVNPDYTFGFTNNFKYGRFDLSVFVNGVQGNDIVNMNTRFNGNLGSFKNISYDMYETAWEAGKDNSEATGPKIMRQFWRNMLFSRRFIEDGSFVRIKNVTLGYNVPVSFLKGVTSIRVAFGVNNLYTFTNYSGFDPEMNSYGDNPALFGVDLGGYPNARTYNLSIRCNF